MAGRLCALQEAALQQAAQAQAQQVALVVRPPSVPDSWRVQQPGLATGALGLAALVAGASLANSRIKEGRPVPGVTELGRLLRWAVHTLAGATAAVGRGAAVAGRAVQQALEPPPAPAPRRRRTLTPRPEECAAGAAAVVGKRQEYAAAAAAASLAARQAAAQEAAYLSAAGGPAPQAPHGKAQRLSEDELQQRIAVMKGEVSPRTPVPQVGGLALTCAACGCHAGRLPGTAALALAPAAAAPHPPALLCPACSPAAPRTPQAAPGPAQARRRPHHRQQVW